MTEPEHRPLRPPEGDDEGPRHPPLQTILVIGGVRLLVVLLAVISTLQQT